MKDALARAILAHPGSLTVRDVEGLANFRERGGVTRLCAALIALSDAYRGAPLAARDALEKAHGFNDGDGPLIVGNPDEVLATITKALLA